MNRSGTFLCTIFLLLNAFGASAQNKPLPKPVRDTIVKELSRLAKDPSLGKGKGHRIEFKKFNTDSSSYISFEGKYDTDSTMKTTIKYCTLKEKSGPGEKPWKDRGETGNSKPRWDGETYKAKITFRTPCVNTDHHPSHMKEIDPQNNCIWGDPIPVPD